MTAMLIAAGLTASYAFADQLPLCIQNPAGLDPDTLREFRTELSLIVRASDGPAALWSCSTRDAIPISIFAEAPDYEPTALGAARVRGGRVQPDIELYVAPVARIIRTRLGAVLGRSLARVAAHELGHYFSQSQHHDGELMRSGYSGPQLLALRRESFRVPGISVLTQGDNRINASGFAGR